jgi:hypothetical protein
MHRQTRGSYMWWMWKAHKAQAAHTSTAVLYKYHFNCH